MDTVSYLQLLELTEIQSQTIVKQENFIAKLVNENLELENMLNVLMDDEFC